MARRKGRKNKRGTAHSFSILTALFAVTPALFILTNTPAGNTMSPLGALISAGQGGSNSWTNIQYAGWALAQNVVANWVTLIILLAIVFVAVKIVRKLGRGARITKHIRA